ncbi:Uncharacterized protein P3T76_014172 [Phytophthora citrophthora]|uniref:Uncharacterized protein n=1 Tax=Phytophthora citrophthora TaxID=4793 RepID=A0AAD9LBN8_9STRA|nr:Uncharacterized protein P3T76_014172 [Phytophthora citrophthora]
MVIAAELESPANLVKLIGLICEKYGLEPKRETNFVNVHAFLALLRGDAIAGQAATVDEANAYIADLYGKRLAGDGRSLSDNMNATTKYLLKLIRTPGDGAEAPAKKKAHEHAASGAPRDGPLPQLCVALPRRLRARRLPLPEQGQHEPDQDDVLAADGHEAKSEYGSVIVGNRIHDIVEIEVYGFTIPYMPVYVTFYNKITLTVNEWASNSFEAYEGGQFHFCLNIVQIDNNLIYLEPVNPTYSFSKPVNYIDSFSLSFGAVSPKIAFDADRMVSRSFDYTNRLGLITFDADHGLVTGDLVYITGFETPSVARNSAVIAEVNRSEGHTVTKRDKTSILIQVDLSALRHEQLPNSGHYPIDSFSQPNATVYFASKRVQIQMRLRYLTSYS